MNLTPNPQKTMISLSIGDPTIFKNLKTDQSVVNAVVEAVKSYNYNGYAPSTGYNEARQAIAKHVSGTNMKFKVKAKDVVICSGCSHALELCITVLANPNQNILIPRPGFPIYKTIADCLQIKCKYYNLLPENNWEIDLNHLESKIDENTAAIIINNPSNPCGSVYSKNHLLKVLEIAAKYCIPIISDEVYDYFVFKGHEFHSLGSLSENVPILTCGGLTKRFLVPGWRLGWIVIHDRHNAFENEIYNGLLGLSQKIMGSNTLVQGSLPAILEMTPRSFLDETIAVVEENAKLTYDLLSSTPGLRPIMPNGAMYMMVAIDMNKFPEFENDAQLVERMVSEQSVFCLPGMIFQIPGFVRLVLTIPEQDMREACMRIKEFCLYHYKPTSIYTEVVESRRFAYRDLKSETSIENQNGFYTENGNLPEILEVANGLREM